MREAKTVSYIYMCPGVIAVLRTAQPCATTPAPAERERGIKVEVGRRSPRGRENLGKKGVGGRELASANLRRRASVCVRVD